MTHVAQSQLRKESDLKHRKTYLELEVEKDKLIERFMSTLERIIKHDKTPYDYLFDGTLVTPRDIAKKELDRLDGLMKVRIEA